MNDKQNEMADFLLSQFVDGCVNRDDMLDSIYDKYDNDITPHSVLQTLKDDGLIYDWGEAYYKLTENGVKAAKKGYGKYKSQQNFWQNVEKANKLTTLAKFLYGTGGFIAGWLAKVLADALGM
nr:hypothetical protein [Prevotella sp.]